MSSNLLIITIKWSKTIQFGQCKHTVPLLAIPGSDLCPVTAFQNMVTLVPGNDKDPLVMKVNRKKVTIDLFRIPEGLEVTYCKMGRNGRAYSSHSLRRGGTTYLAAAGVPRNLIKIMGDWKSDAINKYLDVSLESKVQVAQKVRQALLQEH